MLVFTLWICYDSISGNYPLVKMIPKRRRLCEVVLKFYAILAACSFRDFVSYEVYSEIFVEYHFIRHYVRSNTQTDSFFYFFIPPSCSARCSQLIPISSRCTLRVIVSTLLGCPVLLPGNFTV